MILRISDHAMLRFFERAHGLPVEELRETLSRDLSRAAAAAQGIGGGHYAIRGGDGLSYVIKAGVVVTVLDRDMKCTSLAIPEALR